MRKVLGHLEFYNTSSRRSIKFVSSHPDLAHLERTRTPIHSPDAEPRDPYA
jgi:hypothetical protein